MSNYFPYDFHNSYTLMAASTTAVAAGQTTSGAGNFTLTASPSTTDGLNHKVSLTSGSNESGVNFTITGTDLDNTVVSEVLAGPSGNTVSSVQYYATVTSIAVNAAVSNSTSAGFAAPATSRRYPLVHSMGGRPLPGIAVDLGGGTCTFDIDITYEDIYANAPSSPADSTVNTWFTPSAFSSKSANTDGTLLQPATAARFRVESFSSTPTIKVHIIQSLARS